MMSTLVALIQAILTKKTKNKKQKTKNKKQKTKNKTTPERGSKWRPVKT